MSFRNASPSRKTEVAVVTPGFASPPGGCAQVAGELITVMARRTPFHFTWAAHGIASPQAHIPPQDLLPMQGWAWFEKISSLAWPFWNRESRNALRQAIFASDLVWIHGTLYPGAWAAYYYARKFGRPVLATQYTSPAFTPWRSHPLRHAFLWLADRLLASPLLKRARQVTFTNAAAAGFYQRRAAFKSAAKVIPNGIEGDVFHPPSTEDYRGLRTRFALRDDQPVLLFSGSFSKSAGLPIIRRMAELLPRWRFWLAGQGRLRPEGWYLPNVQVFRNRSIEALADLYKAADLLIMPGIDPESPHVLQQALACQLPVMCNPAVVEGHAGAARCLVINADPAAPESTARHWVQKLKAGKDAWPVPPEGAVPFDSSWDWLQVAAHYTEILQSLSRAAA